MPHPSETSLTPTIIEPYPRCKTAAISHAGRSCSRRPPPQHHAGVSLPPPKKKPNLSPNPTSQGQPAAACHRPWRDRKQEQRIKKLLQRNERETDTEEEKAYLRSVRERQLLADEERRVSVLEHRRWAKQSQLANQLITKEDRQRNGENQRLYQRMIALNLFAPDAEFAPPTSVAIADIPTTLPPSRASATRCAYSIPFCEDLTSSRDLAKLALPPPCPEILHIPHLRRVADADLVWDAAITAKFRADYARGYICSSRTTAPDAATPLPKRAARDPVAVVVAPKSTPPRGPAKTIEGGAPTNSDRPADQTAISVPPPPPPPPSYQPFHPKRWIRPEADMAALLYRLYGPEWELISQLMGRSKAPDAIQRTHERVRGDWALVEVTDLRATVCGVCQTKAAGAPMVFCDCCDRAYHLQCTRPPLADIPENEWFCSHGCLAIGQLDCSNCMSASDESLIIICDRCERGFHTYCLSPPLAAIPCDDRWYCDRCAAAAANVVQQSGISGGAPPGECSEGPSEGPSEENPSMVESDGATPTPKPHHRGLDVVQAPDWPVVGSCRSPQSSLRLGPGPACDASQPGPERCLLPALPALPTLRLPHYILGHFANHVCVPCLLARDGGHAVPIDFAGWPTDERTTAAAHPLLPWDFTYSVLRRMPAMAVARASDLKPVFETILLSIEHLVDQSLANPHFEAVPAAEGDVLPLGSPCFSGPTTSLPLRLRTVTATANDDGAPPPSAYILRVSPAAINLSELVLTLRHVTWDLSQEVADQLAIGDRLFLWDSSKDSGIVAIGLVVSQPEYIAVAIAMRPFMLGPDFMRWKDPVPLRCKVVIDYILPSKLRRATLLASAFDRSTLAPLLLGQNLVRLDGAQIAALDVMIARHGKYAEAVLRNWPASPARLREQARDLWYYATQDQLYAECRHEFMVQVTRNQVGNGSGSSERSGPGSGRHGGVGRPSAGVGPPHSVPSRGTKIEEAQGPRALRGGSGPLVKSSDDGQHENATSGDQVKSFDYCQHENIKSGNQVKSFDDGQHENIKSGNQVKSFDDGQHENIKSGNQVQPENVIEHGQVVWHTEEEVASVSMAPVSTAPASTAPASTAPASTAPASTAPVSTAPTSPTTLTTQCPPLLESSTKDQTINQTKDKTNDETTPLLPTNEPSRPDAPQGLDSTTPTPQQPPGAPRDAKVLSRLPSRPPPPKHRLNWVSECGYCNATLFQHVLMHSCTCMHCNLHVHIPCALQIEGEVQTALASPAGMTEPLDRIVRCKSCTRVANQDATSFRCRRCGLSGQQDLEMPRMQRQWGCRAGRSAVEGGRSFYPGHPDQGPAHELLCADCTIDSEDAILRAKALLALRELRLAVRYFGWQQADLASKKLRGLLGAAHKGGAADPDLSLAQIQDGFRTAVAEAEDLAATCWSAWSGFAQRKPPGSEH